MKKFLISLEQTFTVAGLMLYSGTPLDAFLSDGFTRGQNDRTIFRLLFTLTYVVSLVLLILRWKKATYVLSRDSFIWPLIGICALSGFWSLDSDITIRRVVGLVGTTIFGIYLASRYTLKEQLNFCLIMLGISAIMCFVFALVVPQYGISGDAWRGIYYTKNVLGKRFVLSGAVCLFVAITNRENRWVSGLGYITSGVLVLLSKSTTSLGNFIMITGAIFIYYRILRLKYKIMIPILTFFSTLSVLFYVWFITQADALLGSLGKDTTLTGRVDLWPAVFEMIQKKPWLGYGYGAFWESPNTESGTIIQTVQWNAPNSHNGFLDLWLGLGLLGLLVFLIGFAVNFLRALYLIRLGSDETDVNPWILVYLTFVILSNLTETTLLDQNSLEWVLYVAAVFSSQIYTPRATV